MATHWVPPSRLSSLLHDRCHDSFVEVLGADEAKLGPCWAELRRSPEFAEHVWATPFLRRLDASAWRRVIPLTLHEDAGPFSKRSSVSVISFNGMFGNGGEKRCQLPVATFLKESGAVPAAVLDSLWGPILEDFQRLATDGVGGWRFLLLFAKGDMEQRSVSWGLPSYNGLQPCSECPADRRGRPFTDLHADALWRATETMTKAAYFARASFAHPLMGSVFSWRFFVPYDLMHVADCNGAANIIGGSLLRPLVVAEGIGWALPKSSACMLSTEGWQPSTSNTQVRLVCLP